VFRYSMIRSPRIRPATLLVLACLIYPALAAPSVGAAGPSAGAAALRDDLARYMRSAGSASGAFVSNATTGKVVFRWSHARPRILASNTKIYTTATALARFGTEARLHTDVRGDGELSDDGVYRGNLYLVGGGDPTFGSSGFARRSYGAFASVEALAEKLDRAGIEHVSGRIFGDESGFDSLRGGPDSGYGTSPYIGPLSALGYNRGLGDESGRSFQGDPPSFAAARLDAALKSRGIRVRGAPRAARRAGGTDLIAVVESPTMARLAQLTNKPSDNYFAEMLSKALAMQRDGRGTTKRGAKLAAGFARRLGAAPAALADGSGLSRGNRASPVRVAKLLLALRARDEFPAFFDSLSIAGRDGTLATRMRSGSARGNCRGKTGTLSNVSALSGYCRARSGQVYVFSILMNGVDPYGARSLQDGMLQAIAGMR
jgi:D-alanyl-D-alanine carboxypeptidase/D-alanyl-D-alanine-endopeptidase (penicillin-binding protein 4)